MPDFYVFQLNYTNCPQVVQEERAKCQPQMPRAPQPLSVLYTASILAKYWVLDFVTISVIQRSTQYLSASGFIFQEPRHFPSPHQYPLVSFFLFYWSVFFSLSLFFIQYLVVRFMYNGVNVNV
jgi:hypothetical protein